MNRVFVSSTFTGLVSHRAAVREGIRQLGLIDVAMENLGARDERPKDECLRLVQSESDPFVGICAHLYGFFPRGNDISITESEYEAATRANLPRFIYLRDSDHPWLPRTLIKGRQASGWRNFVTNWWRPIYARSSRRKIS